MHLHPFSSQVYGFTEERSRVLRDIRNDNGFLRQGILSSANKPYLPIAGATEVDCRRDPTESNIGCLLAGDIRANEQVRKLFSKLYGSYFFLLEPNSNSIT